MIKQPKIITILLIIFILLLIPIGCWDNKELEERAIVLGVAVDSSKTGDEILLTVELPKFEAAGGNQAGQVEPVIMSNAGPAIFNTIRNFTFSLGKKLFWGNVAVVIVSQDFASKSIYPLIDFFARDPELRLSPFLVVAKDNNANNILKGIKGQTETMASQQILGTIKAQKETGEFATDNLHDFFEKLQAPGIQPVASVIEQAGGDKSYVVKGVAVFREDRVAGWLEMKEAKGYNWLTDNIKGGLIKVDYEQEKAVLVMEIVRSSTKPEVQIVNEQIIFKPTIKVAVNIAEMDRAIDITSQKSKENLKKATEGEIREYLEGALSKLQDIKSDAIGIGEYIYRNNPAYWKTVEADWDAEYFPLVKLEPDINVSIRHSGLMLKPTRLR